MSVLPQAPARTVGDKVPLLAMLLISSLMSVALVAFRIYYSGHVTYIFLVWNLFLAWVPLGSALAFWYLSQYGWRTLPLLALFLGGWFFFFPNSPYIVTDFLHLTPRHNVPLWYDLLLIFSFAWNGLILGLLSLWIVQGVIEQQAGRLASWLVVLATLATSGFGIYIGRFLRWNSWDLLFEPRAVVSDILIRLVDPLAHPRTIAVTILFSGFLTVAYLTFAFLTRARWTSQV
jgi:uncharacterized membrane protein